jgi:hypothetical protein
MDTHSSKTPNTAINTNLNNPRTSPPNHNAHSSADEHAQETASLSGLVATTRMSPAFTNLMTSELSPPMLHLPTTLIEFWFRKICPMRSTYDSELNYNRQLACATWTISEASYFTLQTMAASCLVNVMPQLRQTLQCLKRQAQSVVQHKLSQFYASEASVVTTDLVFGVFALGTSLHWTGPHTESMSEYPWWIAARTLLSRWSLNISTSDILVYAYFMQALQYWEMLLAVTGTGSYTMDVQKKRKECLRGLHQAIGINTAHEIDEPEPTVLGNTNHGILGTRPNSWCGVSNEVIRLFGQVLALCYDAISRTHDLSTSITVIASDTLCDTAIARQLRQELIALDFGSIVLVEELHGHVVQTQDTNTPMSDLYQTAEAFRQAALLQLYMTFDDVEIYFDTEHLCRDGEVLGYDDGEQREYSVLSLALQLSSLLEQIPVASGTKSIHSMLYLTAAAGMRYISRTQRQTATQDLDEGRFYSYQPTITGLVAPVTNNSFSTNVTPSQDLSTDYSSAQDTFSGIDLSFSQSWIDVANARQFVLSRLTAFQRMLPHASSHNLVHFVGELWRRYDEPRLIGDRIHWLRVWKDCTPGAMPW